ncbi:MAG: hypothetical protein ACYC5M_16330 [Anaerolineae bacterium]
MAITGDRGSSLLGELIAIAIIVITVTVLLTGLATGSRGTQIVEARITAENLARRQMESIKNAPFDPTGAYAVLGPEGIYSIELVGFHWEASTDSFVEGAATSDGLQYLQILVHSSMRADGPVFALEGFKADRP